MKLRDAWGWPVVTVEGRHLGIKISNIMRILLWTNLRKTWQMRHEVEAIPKLTPASAWRAPGSPQVLDRLPKNGQPLGLHHFGDTQ